MFWQESKSKNNGLIGTLGCAIGMLIGGLTGAALGVLVGADSAVGWLYSVGAVMGAIGGSLVGLRVQSRRQQQA